MSNGFQVPGFRSFVIEAFAINCCLYSVLDRSFDFHDANTVRYMNYGFVHSFFTSFLSSGMTLLFKTIAYIISPQLATCYKIVYIA